MKYKERVEIGLCGHCGKRELKSKTLCEFCLDKTKEWRSKKKDKKNICRNCSRLSIPGRTLCESCEKSQKEYEQKIKDLVYDQYGGYICACCGEKEKVFLSIDHIDGGGNEHRRNLSRGDQTHFYRWLRRNNCPKGFQILCHNCQRGKHLCGVCPHQRSKK